MIAWASLVTKISGQRIKLTATCSTDFICTRRLDGGFFLARANMIYSELAVAFVLAISKRRVCLCWIRYCGKTVTLWRQRRVVCGTDAHSNRRQKAAHRSLYWTWNKQQWNQTTTAIHLITGARRVHFKSHLIGENASNYENMPSNYADRLTQLYLLASAFARALDDRALRDYRDRGRRNMW